MFPLENNQNDRNNNQQNQNNINFSLIIWIGKVLIISLILLQILALLTFLFNQSISDEGINFNMQIKEINYLCYAIIIISIAPIISLNSFLKQIQDVKLKWNNFIRNQNINYQISTLEFFKSYFGQGIFYPLRYSCLYQSIALILLVSKLLPQEVWVCYNTQDGKFKVIKDYQNVNTFEDSNQTLYKNCILKHQNSLFEGTTLQILVYYSIFISITLFIIQIMTLLQQIIYFKNINHQICQQKILNLDFPKVKYQANRFCCYLALYSLCKVQIFIVISCLTKNQSSIYLIGSNIYFHILIFIVMLQVVNNIDQIFLQQIQDVNTEDFYTKNICFRDYFVLIDSLLCVQNRKNKIFFIMISLSIIFAFIGRMLFHKQQIEEEIINYDNFIEYDCFLFLNILVILITIKYLLFTKHFQISQYDQINLERKSEIPCIQLNSSVNDSAVRECEKYMNQRDSLASKEDI